MDIELIEGWINGTAPTRLNQATAKIAGKIHSCLKKTQVSKFPQGTNK